MYLTPYIHQNNSALKLKLQKKLTGILTPKKKKSVNLFGTSYYNK